MSNRKSELLEVAAKLASKHGAKNVTRRMVAQQASVSEALVSSYLGTRDKLQAAAARKAKALGLALPSKEAEAKIGAKLRAHGPRDPRDTRKRSAKEVQAIKDKAAGKRPSKVAAKKATAKKAAGTVAKRASSPTPGSRETKPAPAPKTKTPKPKSTPAAPGPANAPLPSPPSTAARMPKTPPLALPPANTASDTAAPPLPLPGVLGNSL